jgi:hypothetical protein
MSRSTDSPPTEEPEGAARVQEAQEVTGPQDTGRRRGRRLLGSRPAYPKRRAGGIMTIRVRPYLPAELARRMAQRCVVDRITISAAVTAAVEQWVDDTSDRMLILRRLDRLGRAIERIHRDTEFHSKAFSVFMHTWLVHTRSVAPQDRAAALESAKKRYRDIVNQVVDEFSDGSRFIDDLPKEALTNDAELDAILARADTGQKKERP